MAAAALQPSTVTYEDLADLEADFDDLDVELLRHQARRERELYARRARLVRRIPHFWPLVLEQAPPEIDQCIQPTDAAVLLSALEDVEVTRFEVEGSSGGGGGGGGGGGSSGEDDSGGDPRSLAFRFTFAPNDYFEDRTLEKRFWQRRAKAGEGASGSGANGHTATTTNTTNTTHRHRRPGWTGLVSEPVAIRWKRGRDPTDGLLDLAIKVWHDQADETAQGDKDKADAKDKADNIARLQAKLDKTSMGGVSFFAWFGYVGRRISAAESREAEAEERAARAERAVKRAEREKKGEEDDEEEDDDEDEDEDEDEDDTDPDEYPYDIFPDGDTLAVTLAEDLWPNAIKYFRQAQEQDAASDDDFESGSEEDEDDDNGAATTGPPAKKQKT